MKTTTPVAGPVAGAGRTDGPTESGSRRPRRARRLAVAAIAVLALLALLGLAWGGYWMVLAGQVEAGVHEWIAERRAEGYDVRYAAIERGGFPRSAHVIITAPAVAASAVAASAAAGGGAGREAVPWVWSATHLIAAIDPFNPRHLTLDGPGAHSLRVGEGAESVHYHAEARQLTVAARAGDEAATLSARDLVLRPVAGAAVAPVSADPGLQTTAIASLDVTGRKAPQGPEGHRDAIAPGYHLKISAGDVVLPAWLELPLGHHIARIDLEAAVRGDLVPAPWPQALFLWRDAGGVVDVAALQAHYGPLTLSGSGTLALDSEGQPIGAFATRTSGLFGAIDELRATGYMNQGEALVAKLAVNVLAGTPERQAPVSIPLTLQDRILTVGPIALMRLPEISWLPTRAAP
jgi:hypothetical protein